MKIITTTLLTTALTLVSTSVFAADTGQALTIASTQSAAHVVKAPVLLNANPHGQNRRIIRVVKMSQDKPVARDASNVADGKFVYKFGKNVKTKTYRPSAVKADTMPNLFKK